MEEGILTMYTDKELAAKELAARVFGPGAEPLPGFSDAVQVALERIGGREKIVFLRRLGGMTLEEVGKELGLTRERVRQLEARAIRRLRWETVKYVSSTESLPPPPLSVEDIEKLLAHASRDQREAWRNFRDTFSPEQVALWRRYWLLGSRARKGEACDEERSLVWKEFTNSLADEQRALWRAYRRASAYTRKVRAALRRAREGGIG
jgi:transcriptional regulator with XRE-family HTH domain